TETRAAVEVVTLLALTRPDVAFTLTSDDRSLIDVRPTTRPIDRVHALWGPQLTGTLLPIAYREGPLEVRGFAQRPAQAKPAGRAGSPRGGGATGGWGIGARGLGCGRGLRCAARDVRRRLPSPWPRAPNPVAASSLRQLHRVPDRLGRRDRGPALRARTGAVR